MKKFIACCLLSCVYSFSLDQVINTPQPNSLDGVSIQHASVVVAPDVRLHCTEAGERSDLNDNVVLMLHGFPDFWYTWKSQIPSLVRAGYFVVAPDLRGYGASDKPFGIEEYGAEAVTGDVEALRRHYCGEKPLALLAGHDWGGAIVWATLQRHTSVANRAVVLNVPHPVSFAEGFAKPMQLLRSAYIFAFQLPWFPDLFLKTPVARWALTAELEAAVSAGVGLEASDGVDAPPSLSPDDYKWYDTAIRTEGAARGGLSYYRASAAGLWPGFLPEWVPEFGCQVLRWLHGNSSLNTSLKGEQGRVDRGVVIETPVLVIWGEFDNYLEIDLATPKKELVPNLLGPVFLKGTHWVHHSQPRAVNDELLRFLAGESCVNEGLGVGAAGGHCLRIKN
mmetsp:Transcript_35165/g.71686  ORF Transcript_35165/g.71686 Transcript_35165/m.71686 type:complete len:393 (+) Transcript_35165:57-1235(+)